MAFKLLARTREKTGTTGTGDITVSGVVSADNVPFSAGMSVGDTACMMVVSGDGIAWEEFWGTYSATNTIQRTTTITNNSGTTAHVSLTGTSRVFCIGFPSDWSGFFDRLIGSATNTIPIRGAGGWTGISPSSYTALLSTMVGDTGSGGTKGLVPAPAAGDAAAGKFLKADGTFALPGDTDVTTLAGDTDVNISSPAANDFLQYETSDNKWHNVRGKYVIALFTGDGVLTASQDLLYHKFSKGVTFPANFGSYQGHTSEATSVANATASTVINVDKSTGGAFSNVGTLTFPAGSGSVTFATSGGGAVSFAQGDVLRVQGPASADATLAGVAATLVGYET